MNVNATMNRPEVGETNGLINAIGYHDSRHAQGEIKSVYWTEPGLEITRLRLLSDPGFPFWDVSYCHGILDGKHVDVKLPFSQLPKRSMKAALYAEAKATGRFIKGLFNALSQLN